MAVVIIRVNTIEHSLAFKKLKKVTPRSLAASGGSRWGTGG